MSKGKRASKPQRGKENHVDGNSKRPMFSQLTDLLRGIYYEQVQIFFLKLICWKQFIVAMDKKKKSRVTQAIACI